MTPQEAIKYIEEHNTISDNVKDMAISTLEKQIPKRVDKSYGTKVKAADLENGTVSTFKCYPCPNCGCWLHDNQSNKYCYKCGQALDWSDGN